MLVSACLFVDAGAGAGDDDDDTALISNEFALPSGAPNMMLWVRLIPFGL